MKIRPSRRALISAASLLAAVSLGGVAVTTADAASQRPATQPAQLIQVQGIAAGPSAGATLVNTYGDPTSVQPAALGDQASYRFSIHIEATGSVAKELIDSFSDTFSDVPGFVPQTNSASVAANTKDGKPFIMDIGGAYQRPGREKQAFKIGDNTYTQWVIGRTGTTQYNKEKANSAPIPADADPSAGFAPVLIWDRGFSSWFDKYSSDSVLSCTPQDDQVNDMSVRSCDFNVTDDDQMNDLLAVFSGESIVDVKDAAADLYLSNDSATKDVPVRLAVQFSGKDAKNKDAKLTVTMDITDLNKKSVTVDAGK